MACEDNLTFMQRLQDDQLQMKLIVTSPPYNLGKDYETKSSLDEYLEMQAEVIKHCVALLHQKVPYVGRLATMSITVQSYLWTQCSILFSVLKG